MCEFFQFSAKQSYNYATNCKKKARVLPIFSDMYTANNKKVMYLKKSALKKCILVTSHENKWNCWFLAHIYTTNYKDHFIILSCAHYFRLYNFIKFIISFNFLLFFVFPFFSLLSPNNYFHSTHTMFWLKF